MVGTTDQPPALLSIAEAAARLRTSPRTVRRLIARGQLRAARITDRLWRVSAEDVERLAEPTLWGDERLETPRVAAQSTESDAGLLWLAETAWAGDVPLGRKGSGQ